MRRPCPPPHGMRTVLPCAAMCQAERHTLQEQDLVLLCVALHRRCKRARWKLTPACGGHATNQMSLCRLCGDAARSAALAAHTEAELDDKRARRALATLQPPNFAGQKASHVELSDEAFEAEREEE